MSSMCINIDEQMVKWAKEKSAWDLGNDTLYALCTNNPKHEADGAIVSKIWLIGRSYSATIERRKNATEATGDFYLTVAKKIMSSGLDELLDGLPEQLRDPWHDLGNVITTHKHLVNVFHELTALNKRSLASKYLHFHKRELFYIYDSRALRAIKKIVPRLKGVKEFTVEGQADHEYRTFCRRCQYLRDTIAERYDERLSPREIDNLLLRVHY